MIFVLLTGCSPEYEIVQQLSPDRYHIQGVKNKEVIILITQNKYKEGQVVKWKDIKKFEKE